VRAAARSADLALLQLDHVWTLTSGKDTMSAHVAVGDTAPLDEVTRTLHGLVHEWFGIDHATIQVETASPRLDSDAICGAGTVCDAAPAGGRSTGSAPS
jgi:hypothetical protein